MAEATAVTYYELFEVPETATRDEITKAYKRVRRDAHPDRGGSAALWRFYQQAYETLSDPTARAKYDRSRPDDERSEPAPESRRSQCSEGGPSQPRPSYPANDTDYSTPRWMPQVALPDLVYFPPIGVAPTAQDPRWQRVPPRSKAARVAMALWWALAGIAILALAFTLVAMIDLEGPDVIPRWIAGTGLWGVALFIAPQIVTVLVRRKRVRDNARMNSLLVEGDRQLDIDLDARASATRRWGTPGRVSGGRFGRNADIGNIGERITERHLSTWFGQVPAARVFHGLRWPGTQNADIDHAVLVGDRLAVIDTKNWKRSRYYWDGSSLFREGEQLPAFRIGIAAAALAAQLPRPVRIQTWVVLVNPDCEIEDRSQGTTRLVSPSQLIEELAAFLLYDPQAHPGVVDRTLVRALRNHLT